MCVRAETKPNYTGVADTSAVCMGGAKMPSGCTELTETLSDRNRVPGTPLFI